METTRSVRAAYGAALLGPVAVVVLLVLRHGVNVPFWDQWELVGPLTRLQDGTLGWGEIFRQHNEHRMVVPKIVMLSLASLTGWNVVAEMLASTLLAVAVLGLLIALTRPILRPAGPMVRLWATFTISAMLFSQAQWQNWLWGWQVQWFLGALAAVSAIALATWSLASGRPWAHVAGAAAAALACQFSIASGVVVWGCCALVFAFHAQRRRILPIWLAVAIAASAVFLVGYERAPGHPSLLSAVEHPLSFLLFLGNYLSGPLGRHAAIGIAVALGFGVLAVMAARRRRREPQAIVPWIALGAFAGANAALTGIGRVGMGAGRGLSSQYVTIALLMSVSLVPLGIAAFRAGPDAGWTPIQRKAWMGGAALLSFLTILGDIGEWKRAADHAREMIMARDCLLAIEAATDDCLGLLYPDPAAVRAWEPQLRAIRWSGFTGNAL